MNIFPMRSIFLAGFLFLSHASEGETIAPTLLRYGFSPGETNAYKLLIESQGENGREAIGGNWIVSIRKTGTNLITLTFKGHLQPKPIAGAPMTPFYRSGNEMSLSAYTMFPSMPGDTKELTIDDRGTVVREAGEVVLPIPLGALIGSLVETFPIRPSNDWEQEEDIFVLDEPLLQGPARVFLNSSGRSLRAPMPGHLSQGALRARQKTQVRVTQLTPQAAVLQKTLKLETYFLTGTEPCVSATGDGKFILDRVSGWPKRVELECKTVVVTDNLSRRSVLTLRWEMIEGTERDTVLSPPPIPPAVELTFEKLAKLTEQLQSSDAGIRRSASRELSGAKLDIPTPEIFSGLVSLAGNHDDTARYAALTMLASYGTAEHVPLLIKGLREPDATIRTTVTRGLARLKDQRAADALADLLASGQSEYPYSRFSRGNDATLDALVQIGPAAEPAILPLLKEKNIDTLAQACAVLKQIGSRKSLDILKELTLYPNKELSEAAAEACRSIQAREHK
jgi:hypothetical protein